MLKKHLLISGIATLILMSFGCRSADESRVLTPTPQTSSVLIAETMLPGPIPTVTLTPFVMTKTALASPIPIVPSAVPSVEPELEICSPIADYEIEDLPNMIFNPFSPPTQPNLDGPHQGVDFAVVDPVTRIALEDGIVQSVLDGRVAAVISDRFPYGNAVLIEAPLESLPREFFQGMVLPTPAAELYFTPALTCPEVQIPDSWEFGVRSIYILYAHLKERFIQDTGGEIGCGEPLGLIGSSGNALNPHVHIEVRVGPGNARFTSMAHYDASADAVEMANYCSWRVSGMFQLVDPMQLFLKKAGDKQD